MTGIDRVGALPPSRPASRPMSGTPAAGFAPPSEPESPEPAADAARTAAGAAAAAVALDSLLALQQVDMVAERDRAAHRRGRQLLAALGRLQRALLGGGDTAEVLAELRTLAVAVPEPVDPGLAAAIDQVVLRARIELARQEG